MTAPAGVLIVKEIADVLAEFSHLPCQPDLTFDRGIVTLTLRIESSADADSFELHERLRYAVGVAQIRAFAERYGIQPDALERFIDSAPYNEKDGAS